LLQNGILHFAFRLSQSPGIALKGLGRWISDLSKRSPALKWLRTVRIKRN